MKFFERGIYVEWVRRERKRVDHSYNEEGHPRVAEETGSSFPMDHGLASGERVLPRTNLKKKEWWIGLCENEFINPAQRHHLPHPSWKL